MREKELRLALVCYGGISLAVYMHGITKEVWHLVRASRGRADDSIALVGSETVYRDLLARIEDETGLRVRVLADIIAGASAGGINGIFLAQAIATGQSLDPLTGLWLDEADVDRLMDPAARASSRIAKLWATPLAWAFANRQGEAWDDDLDEYTRTEIHDKLQRFVRSRWFEPPFGGKVFTNLLLDAFDAMAALPGGKRLLPDAQPLDLLVTVTDFRGHEEMLRLNSPPEIVETEHRLTLSYRDAPQEGARLGDVAGLAFAGRATASFPGAFPPFAVAELDEVLETRGKEWPGRSDFLGHAFPHLADAKMRESTVLIDGSVLANAPFRPAIDALKSRPARREIDRRFVYIDPKPGIRSVKINRKGESELPGFFTTILGALSDLPREQPIRDNLDWIERRSARNSRMRRVVESLRPAVEQSVQALFGRTMFLDRPTPPRLASWRARAEERAARDAGHSYAAYAQLKLAALIDDVPLVKRDALWSEVASIGPERFFEAHDLPYRIRRLRFVSRQLASLAERAGAADIDNARTALYGSLARFLDLQMTGERGDLIALDTATDADLTTALSAMPRAERRATLLAYLGFPFYDVATYALLQGEGLDEFDAIKVDRISPEDAQSIRQGDARATLKGVQFNSFGAFFSRTYRENDYLWGRLHGADRLIDILISTLPDTATLSAAAVTAAKQAAFDAILDEEALRCKAIDPLIATLRREVAAMGGKTEASGLG